MSTTTVATTTAAIRAPVSLAIKATATTIKQKLVYVIAKLRSLPPADGYREERERKGGGYTEKLTY